MTRPTHYLIAVDTLDNNRNPSLSIVIDDVNDETYIKRVIATLVYSGYDTFDLYTVGGERVHSYTADTMVNTFGSIQDVSVHKIIDHDSHRAYVRDY